jgi:hypothetical protein
VRQHVERRDLLRDVQRVALREDQDAGRELQGLRHGGDVRQRDQRVGNRHLLGGGDLSGRVVRVGRLVADRDDDVLDGPDRLDAGALGRRGEVGEQLGERERAGVGVHEAEFHAALHTTAAAVKEGAGRGSAGGAAAGRGLSG